MVWLFHGRGWGESNGIQGGGGALAVFGGAGKAQSELSTPPGSLQTPLARRGLRRARRRVQRVPRAKTHRESHRPPAPGTTAQPRPRCPSADVHSEERSASRGPLPWPGLRRPPPGVQPRRPRRGGRRPSPGGRAT